jgi:hypothetical protein
MQSKSINKDNVPNVMYQLAKTKNKPALTLIFKPEHLDLIEAVEKRTNDHPIFLLAKEGDRESTEFLVNEFRELDGRLAGGRRHFRPWRRALSGAATGGHVELVNYAIKHTSRLFEWSFSEKPLDYAVSLAAHYGHVELMNDLIGRGAMLMAAVKGAFSADRVELAIDLILRKVSWDLAKTGLEELIKRESKGSDDKLIGHQGKIFQLISSIGNSKIRKNLADSYKINIDLIKAHEINRLMQIPMDYQQATACQVNAYLLHCWFLQGIQLVTNEKREMPLLPLEIFILISSFVIGLSGEDTLLIFKRHLNTMPKKLCDAAIQRLDKKYNSSNSFWNSMSGIFGSKELEMSIEYTAGEKSINERYQKRLAIQMSSSFNDHKM